MSALTNILSQSANTLWSVSWQVSVLAGLIWLVSLLSRKAPPNFRYWLWCIVLLRLCLPMNLTLPIGLEQHFRHFAERLALAFMERPMSPRMTENVQPIIALPAENLEPISYASEIEPFSAASTAETQASDPGMTTIDTIAMSWFVLVILFGGSIVWRTLRINNRLKKCPAIERSDLVALCNRLCIDLGIKQQVQLRYMNIENADSPAAIGIFRPKVFLPRRIVEQWSLKEIEPILLHELAHIKRYDLVVNWLQMIVQVVYFFHPLVWLANWKIRQLREEICDDVAIQHIGTERKRYGKSILRVMEETRHEPAFGFAGIGFVERKSSLARRIVRIMSDKYRLHPRMTVSSILTLIAVGLVCISLASGKKSQIEGKTEKAVGGGNAETRIIHFPKDRSLGILRVRDWGTPGWEGWEELGPARGRVTVPAGKELSLKVTKEGARGLSPLAKLRPDDLQGLLIMTTLLRDEDLVHLAGLTALRWLSISSEHAGQISPITGAGLVHLQGMKSLQEIDFAFTRINDTGLAHLKKFPSLEWLFLWDCKEISDEGLAHLKDLRLLRKISFCGSPIGDAGVAHLKEMTQLEYLDLMSTKVTDAGLAQLGGLTQLKTLILPPKTSDAGLAHFKGLNSLEELLLTGTQVTDAGLTHLKGLASLKKLRLDGTKVSDAGLIYLKNLPSLNFLNLQRTKISEAGLMELRQALPDCEILYSILSAPAGKPAAKKVGYVGRLEFDKRISLNVKGGRPEEPTVIDVRWIEFTRKKDLVSATLCVKTRNMLDAFWLVTVEMLDAEGNVLRDGKLVLQTMKAPPPGIPVAGETFGRLCKGPWNEVSEATRFTVSIEEVSVNELRAMEEKGKGDSLSAGLHSSDAEPSEVQAPTVRVPKNRPGGANVDITNPRAVWERVLAVNRVWLDPHPQHLSYTLYMGEPAPGNEKQYINKVWVEGDDNLRWEMTSHVDKPRGGKVPENYRLVGSGGKELYLEPADLRRWGLLPLEDVHSFGQGITLQTGIHYVVRNGLPDNARIVEIRETGSGKVVALEFDAREIPYSVALGLRGSHLAGGLFGRGDFRIRLHIQVPEFLPIRAEGFVSDDEKLYEIEFGPEFFHFDTERAPKTLRHRCTVSMFKEDQSVIEAHFQRVGNIWLLKEASSLKDGKIIAMMRTADISTESIAPTLFEFPKDLSEEELDYQRNGEVRSGYESTKSDLFNIEMALESYFKEKKRYPAALSALITHLPYFFTESPIDRFDKEQSPLRLKVNKKGKKYKAYSIGPDHTDNQGLILYDPTNGIISRGDIIKTGPSSNDFAWKN